MSYQSNDRYHIVAEDFVLHSGEVFGRNLLSLSGNILAKPHSSFLSEVKLINSTQAITLENHSFVYHLHMVNGGEIYIKGENVLVVELLVEGRVTLHVPKNTSCWRNIFQNISNDSLITIVQD